MTITEIAQQAHKNAVEKGFFDEPKNIGEMLCLIHSEVSEALECDRKDKYCQVGGGYISSMVKNYNDSNFKEAFLEDVKDTFSDELADIVIRVLDLAAFKGVDLEAHVLAKMRYNSLRPHKHGKKY